MKGSIRLFVTAGTVLLLALGFWNAARAAAGPAGGNSLFGNDFILKVFGDHQVGAQAPELTEAPQVGEDLQSATPEVAETPEVEDTTQVGEDNQGQDQPNETQAPETEANGETHGTITALDGSTVTVDGTVFSLSDASEVKGTLQVGDTVKVEFITNPDGTLAIREIQLSDAQSGSGDSQNSGDTSSGNDHGGSNFGSDDGGNSGPGGGDDGGSGG